MRTIRVKSPSKSWRLIRKVSTGDILTDDLRIYQMGHDDIKAKIADAHAAIAAGNGVPRYKIYHWGTETETFEDYEQLDHIPVMRGEFKFKSIHNGTSSIQIYFTSRAGGVYTLKGDHANDFFRKVGESKILMSMDGYYEFNYSFTKSSTKVFMTLEPDDAHV